MNEKYKKGLIGVLIFLLGIGIFGGILGAGNYGYSQKYEFDVSHDSLIKSVQTFKKLHPEYTVPEGVYVHDSLDSVNHFFYTYLYYPKDNKIVYFHVSKDANNFFKSSINFTALNDGLDLGHWKEVNKDFDRNENLQVKRQFQTTILDKLNLKYTDRGNSMFVFWK